MQNFGKKSELSIFALFGFIWHPASFLRFLPLTTDGYSFRYLYQVF